MCRGTRFLLGLYVLSLVTVPLVANPVEDPDWTPNYQDEYHGEPVENETIPFYYHPFRIFYIAIKYVRNISHLDSEEKADTDDKEKPSENPAAVVDPALERSLIDHYRRFDIERYRRTTRHALQLFLNLCIMVCLLGLCWVKWRDPEPTSGRRNIAGYYVPFEGTQNL